MSKITKQHIFEQRLKGKPIGIVADQITYEEVQLLFDCEVISSIIGYEESGHLIGRASELLESWHCIESDEGPDYECHTVHPGMLVTFRHREKT